MFMADVRNLDEARARLDREADWRAELARSGTGYLGDERNVLIALRRAPELTGLLRFNEFALHLEFTRAPPWRNAEAGTLWTEADDTQCTAWLQSAGLKLRGNAAVANCIHVAARDRSYHPVRAYLESLSWDGEPRAQIWLADYVGATAAPPYLSAIGRKFLISAVARIFNPGCQADHTLVLEGPQDIGKSRTARTLAVDRAWFTDDMPDIHSKDAALQLCGRWIIELAELAAVRRAELEGVKAYLTRPIDVFRPPYGRRTVSVPRQCVFVATTNEVHYLRDPTGNRRFWPVRCGRIDLAALEHDRDQLWAEAVSAFRASEAWHLTPEETALASEEQRERVLVTELEADVGDYLANAQAGGTSEVTVRELLVHALRLDPDKADFAERAGRLGTQVASALQRAGWAKVRTMGRGVNRRTLYRPDTHRGA
jgi:predicted P-loop ATPase